MIIIKNVINTFFNRDIIKSESDDNRNCVYYIDDVDKDMFYNSRYLNHVAYCVEVDQFIDNDDDEMQLRKILAKDDKTIDVNEPVYENDDDDSFLDD